MERIIFMSPSHMVFQKKFDELFLKDNSLYSYIEKNRTVKAREWAL